MTYTVLLSHQAEKFYKKLNKNLKERVKEGLIKLQNEPNLGKALHGVERKLQHQNRKNKDCLFDFRKKQNNIHNSYRPKKNDL